MSTVQTPFRGKATNSEGGDFEFPPSGQHVAVLVALIDLGTHERSFNGKTWEARSILFAWELTDEQDKAGNNFIVGQDYTWSLHKKSNLRPLIEAWIGRALSDEEEFDWGQLLGTSCLVTLMEGKSGTGKKFMEVASVCKPTRHTVVPPAKHTPFAFSLAELESIPEGGPGIPDWVPFSYGKPVADKIRASKEWTGPADIPY